MTTLPPDGHEVRIHFGGYRDGRPACGTKARDAILSSNPADVTCAGCKRTIRWRLRPTV